MNMYEFVPTLIYLIVFMPMGAALISYLIGRKSKTGRDVFVGAVAILEFLLTLALIAVSGWGEEIYFKSMLSDTFVPGSFLSTLTVKVPGICGMGLHFTVDGFRVIYGAIAALMWMVASLFSKEYFAHYRNRNRYYLFQLITLGATEAVFLSADLYTTFVFFEIMSFASYVWVAQDERKESLKAAETYLAVAVIGGMVMLMGLFLLHGQAGTLTIKELSHACEGKNVYPAALCLLVGFGAKAGAFPLHIWLPKAHPVAPAPASALLSGILTKTGIFGVLVISCQILLHDAKWGAFVLMIGTITMFLGAVLGVLSIDFKRTLACSSVSQIGFILVGVGMQGLLGEENGLAVRGTFLHMVNHSLFKLVLFLVAGVIFMNLHKLDLNEIRGFGRKKPLLAFIYLMGALGIGGIPLWNGYVSKTLLHESIVEYTHLLKESKEVADIQSSVSVWAAQRQGLSGLAGSVGGMKFVEWIFLLSGGLTVAYMCKLFVAVFVEKNRDAKVQGKYDAKKKYMKPISGAVLLGSAILFPILGSLPNLTMGKLADRAERFMNAYSGEYHVAFFSLENLKGSVISIAIGALVYVLIVRVFLMEKQEDGSKVYVNRLSKYADLENYLYRPLIEKLLPAVCGFVCSILDILSDGVVVFLRKTIYKDSPKPEVLDEGNEMTHELGIVLNKLELLLNKTIRKDKPKDVDYEHKLALGYSSFKENSTIIGRSLSFGLILFSLGLCATLIYLLVGVLS